MELTKFKELGLSEKILEVLRKKGFEEPTEIQAKSIPVLLNEETDIIGQAQTGTGKTAAFGLPMIERLKENSSHIQALILVPTRELAIQVAEEISSFKGDKKLHVLPIYGGQSMSDQIRRIKSGVDIVVGTPGRIFDHMKRKRIDFSKVSYVVLDEADEMLNMGFLEEVEEILEGTNPNRKTLLFSATMPDRIRNIAKKYMKEHKLISIKKKQLTGDLVDQIYFEVQNNNKLEALCRIIDIEEDFYALIFCRTKVEVDQLSSKLIDRGYHADGIHGDHSQPHRERILEKIRSKKIRILVATDVAARGINVTDLSHVINYSLPQDPESYVHRIGRTGRAGKKGVAITFVSRSEYRKLTFITRITKTDIRKEKIPQISDVVETKKKRILKGLKEIIENETHKNYLTTALQMVEEKDPVEVIAALIKYSLEDELSEKRYTEFNEISVDRQGTSRLFVSFGKKDGLSSQSLVEMIVKESLVPSSRISEVKVLDSFSFLTVPFADAEAILESFSKRDKSKPNIQRAKEQKDRGSSRNFGKSRSGSGNYRGGQNKSRKSNSSVTRGSSSSRNRSFKK